MRGNGGGEEKGGWGREEKVDEEEEREQIGKVVVRGGQGKRRNSWKYENKEKKLDWPGVDNILNQWELWLDQLQKLSFVNLCRAQRQFHSHFSQPFFYLSWHSWAHHNFWMCSLPRLSKERKNNKKIIYSAYRIFSIMTTIDYWQMGYTLGQASLQLRSLN